MQSFADLIGEPSHGAEAVPSLHGSVFIDPPVEPAGDRVWAGYIYLFVVPGAVQRGAVLCRPGTSGASSPLHGVEIPCLRRVTQCRSAHGMTNTTNLVVPGAVQHAMLRCRPGTSPPLHGAGTPYQVRGDEVFGGGLLNASSFETGFALLRMRLCYFTHYLILRRGAQRSLEG